MLPKTQRISTKRFGEIMTSGKNISAGGFYLKTLKSDSVRFAVAVPKKVAKSAIKRHLLKRRVFNILRLNKGLFPAGDYIIFLNKEVADFNKDQFSEGVKNLANKV
jgi:ribonuclease P protein component